MKLNLALVTLSLLVGALPARAASLSYVQTGDAYAVYLDGEQHNGQFDTMDVELTAHSGISFHNLDSGYVGFIPRNPGEPKTFISGWLGLSKAIGGQGYDALDETVTPSSVSFSVTHWGGRIDSNTEPNGQLFLANVFQPGDAGFDVRVRLISAGRLLETLNSTVPIPEPTAWLLGCSCAGAVGIACRQ